MQPSSPQPPSFPSATKTKRPERSRYSISLSYFGFAIWWAVAKSNFRFRSFIRDNALTNRRNSCSSLRLYIRA